MKMLNQNIIVGRIVNNPVLLENNECKCQTFL